MSGDVGDGLIAAVAGVAGRFVATLACGAVVFISTTVITDGAGRNWRRQLGQQSDALGHRSVGFGRRSHHGLFRGLSP